MTYQTTTAKTQIDYFLLRVSDRAICRDCKVVTNACLSTPHKLLIMDLAFKRWSRRRNTQSSNEIQWRRLHGDTANSLRDKLLSEGNWSVNEDANSAWEATAELIRTVARSMLGTSRGGSGPRREAWWWNEDVQLKVKAKKTAYKKLLTSTTAEAKLEDKLKYKEAKKNAKQAVAEARGAAYKTLYQKLDTKEGERDIFKIARARDRRTKDLDRIRCIKDETGRVLIEEKDVKDRWKRYFS